MAVNTDITYLINEKTTLAIWSNIGNTEAGPPLQLSAAPDKRWADLFKQAVDVAEGLSAVEEKKSVLIKDCTNLEKEKQELQKQVESFKSDVEKQKKALKEESERVDEKVKNIVADAEKQAEEIVASALVEKKSIEAVIAKSKGAAKEAQKLLDANASIKEELAREEARLVALKAQIAQILKIGG